MLSQTGPCLFPHTCIHKNAQYAERTASSRPDPEQQKQPALKQTDAVFRPAASLIICVAVNGISVLQQCDVFILD